MTITRAELEALDAADPLAALRQRFHLPRGMIYLDGNSLGVLPRGLSERLREVVEREWGEDLIGGWNRHDWVGLPLRLGAMLAPLLGARADEVVVTDSTSVNLFKLLSAALAARPGRRVILSEAGNFPTDLYVAQGLAAGLGAELRLAPREGLGAAPDADTAVLMLTQVDFRSGALHDVPALTTAAHAAGALSLWDLAHSAGVMPLALNDWEVDLAVGCGYKYLNGGPGAPAFAFVRASLQAEFAPLLQGWFGHARPFAFEPAFEPAPGIARALCGTPPVLAMAALECALQALAGLDLQAVRAKSMALTAAFVALLEQECAGHGLRLVSPREPARRGSQVSVAHAQGYAIMQALIARGVIGDYREPELMRFGFAPCYLRHADLWDAVAILRQVLESRAWDRPGYRTRARVT